MSLEKTPGMTRHGEVKLQEFAAHQGNALDQASRDFPYLAGFSFFYYISDLGQRGQGKIFQFGGGAQQGVAREVVCYQPGVSLYVGNEPKELDSGAREQLADQSAYVHARGGISELIQSQRRDIYDIAFAHNAAQELPDPLLLVQKLHDMTRPNGLVFVNGILGYEWVISSVMDAWKSKRYHFNYDTKILDRSGIAKLDVVVKKTTSELIVPEITDDNLKTFCGEKLKTKSYRKLGDSMSFNRWLASEYKINNGGDTDGTTIWEYIPPNGASIYTEEDLLSFLEEVQSER